MLGPSARHCPCCYLRSARTGARWRFVIPMDSFGGQNRCGIRDGRGGGSRRLRRHGGVKVWCGVTLISKGKIKLGFCRCTRSKTLRDVGKSYWRGLVKVGVVKRRTVLGVALLAAG
jgi:hypothetical protein